MNIAFELRVFRLNSIFLSIDFIMETFFLQILLVEGFTLSQSGLLIGGDGLKSFFEVFSFVFQLFFKELIAVV